MSSQDKKKADKESVESDWSAPYTYMGLFFVAIMLIYVVLLSIFPDPIAYVAPAVPPEKSPSEAKAELAAVAINTYKAARAAQWGQMGDMVGGLLNPILSFISAVGLIFTIRLTVRSMKEAREDAAHQRKIDRLSTRVAALTALHQAATIDYEIYRKAEGAGATAAATKARQRQQELANLLSNYYTNLHLEDDPGLDLPPSLSSDVKERRRIALRETLGFGMGSLLADMADRFPFGSRRP